MEKLEKALHLAGDQRWPKTIRIPGRRRSAVAKWARETSRAIKAIGEKASQRARWLVETFMRMDLREVSPNQMRELAFELDAFILPPRRAGSPDYKKLLAGAKVDTAGLDYPDATHAANVERAHRFLQQTVRALVDGRTLDLPVRGRWRLVADRRPEMLLLGGGKFEEVLSVRLVEVLTAIECRVRKCAGPKCTNLLVGVPRSRTHCSKTCGNLARTKTFRDEKKRRDYEQKLRREKRW